MPYTLHPSFEVPHDPDEPPSATAIDVRLAAGVVQQVNLTWIRDFLVRAANLVCERAACTRLSVQIVDDARMIALHARHSNDPSTTDVLTFDLREDPTLPIDADIVICADEAARRADEFNHSIERELLLYCVHGMLHCMGFNDHDEGDWRRMHAREDEILQTIGVGATFDRRGEAEDRT